MLSRYSVKNISVIRNVKKVFKRKITNNISSSYIVTSGYPDIPIPNVTLPEFFAPYYDKYEKYTAIECFQTKRTYTYGDVRTKGTTLAKALRKILKLQNGDVVGIFMNNIPEYPIASFGILKANLVLTTISSFFTPDEISRQMVDAGVKAIITEVDLISTLKKATQMTSMNIPIVTVKTNKNQVLPENTIDFHEFVNQNVDYPEIQPSNPNDTAYLPYSSGTTGLPKGVEVSHRNLVANMLQDNHPDLVLKTEAAGDFQEVLPTILPLYHVFGYCVVMNAYTMYGAKLTTLPKFIPQDYIAMVMNPKNTILYLVPPVLLMLIGFDGIQKKHLENIRAVISGAAPLAASDEKRFYQKFGEKPILQGYGLSETSPIIACLYPSLMEKEEMYSGSVGRPVPNTQVKIVDPEDSKCTPLGPNIPGELLVKGPQVMKGYLNLPEETKKVLTDDGWLRTGDVCYYNEDGFIFITDRYKELIKVKGHQVPPAELEAVVRSFPGVLDAAVIGVPHEISGEVPRAYVVVKKGDKLDTQKLDEFVSEKVAGYKKLKGGIVVIDQIPKSPSGKILRRELKEEFLKNGV